MNENKNLQPLICFYKNQYIVSEDYKRIEFATEKELEIFLKENSDLQKSRPIILQINFEAFHSDLFKKQKPLYKSPVAQAFLLNQFKTMSEKDLFLEYSTSLDSRSELSPQQVFGQRPFRPVDSKNVFLEKVNFIKEQISNGRLYQINLTAPLVTEAPQVVSQGHQYFFKLKKYFVSPYSAYLPCSGYNIISFSPEMFLSFQKNNEKFGDLKAQPIKGSTHLNQNQTDLLFNSEKENSELSMIVDLLRNDLNTLEEHNSSEVVQHRQLMNLGYIQHTYSEIKIKTDQDLYTILKKTLPAGSISGCPKLESLKLTSEIEPVKRQAYTGVIGWWYQNNFEFNVAIRTFIQTTNQMIYHAGCGIVYDSVAENEYQEWLTKTGIIKKFELLSEY